MEEFGNRHAIADRLPEEVREWEPSARPPLARLLEEEGLAAREQIEQALTEGERTGERLGEVLLRWQLVNERQLAVLLARQWQLSFLDEHELASQANALRMLAPDEARELGAVPLRWEDEVLRVVVAEPTEDRLAKTRARIPEDVAFSVVTHDALTRLLSSFTEEVADGPPTEETPSEGRPRFEELLGSLDDETEQLSRLRQQIQQFAAFVAERDQTAARLEARLAERDQTAARLETELAAARAEREQGLQTIGHLEAELRECDRLLMLADAKAHELVSALGARRGR